MRKTLIITVVAIPALALTASSSLYRDHDL